MTRDTDDHYRANSNNAHIRTNDFKKSIQKILATTQSTPQKTLKAIYNKFESKTAGAISEPNNSDLICRYLTLDKFKKFLHTKSLYFSSASQFTDKNEHTIHQDYNNTILIALGDETAQSNWIKYVKNKTSELKVSCWTELNNHYDDHLMWHCFAEGINGIGITIKYECLKTHLESKLQTKERKGKERMFMSGKINYCNGQLCPIPFNKHPMFENEREVRFVFKCKDSKPGVVCIKNIFNKFGIRFHPSANASFVETITDLWVKYGGDKNRVHHPL